MQVEILNSSGSAFKQIHHNNQTYATVPNSGEYSIKLINNSPHQRMAVVSVDGINVIDGKDAGYDGSGYVIPAWQSTTIKGFLRSNSECAKFSLTESEGSYAAQTGRGTQNTGVIGVAVFDEKPKPVLFQPPIVIHEHHHHSKPLPWQPNTFWYGTRGTSSTTLGGDIGSTCDSYETKTLCSTAPEATKSLTPTKALNLGTAYGKVETFYTQTTTFERASSTPSLVMSIRYGTIEKLKEWGVPVDVAVPPIPNAFPAAQGFAQPPAGWQR